MENKKLFAAMLAMVLALVMAAVGCGKGSKSGGGETNGNASATASLDKLKFTSSANVYLVEAVNDKISGAVVIPDTYNKKPVVQIGTMAFSGCTGLTSVTIPASVTTIGSGAFEGSTNLTSVTFQGRLTINSKTSFPGDLEAKYNGAGTYTRAAGSDTWTKQ